MGQPGKLWYFRSLRSRALLVALASLAFPLLVVLGWLAAERGYEHGMRANAAFSAEEARQLLLAVRQLPGTPETGGSRCGNYRTQTRTPLGNCNLKF